MESRVSFKLASRGYWTYFPFERIRRLRKRPGGRKVVEWVERAYYPRYVFVMLRYCDESFEEIEELDEISCVVRTRIDHRPLRVPDAIMTAIMDEPMVKLGEQEKNHIRGLIREIVLDEGTLILSKGGDGRRRITRVGDDPRFRRSKAA